MSLVKEAIENSNPQIILDDLNLTSEEFYDAFVDESIDDIDCSDVPCDIDIPDCQFCPFFNLKNLLEFMPKDYSNNKTIS